MWSIQKYYSELIFFRKTILEQSSKFTNQFPEFDGNKEIIGEMNLWLKECGEILAWSAPLMTLYYVFLKADIMK